MYNDYFMSKLFLEALHEMHWLKTGVTHYHAQLKRPDKVMQSRSLLSVRCWTMQSSFSFTRFGLEIH